MISNECDQVESQHNALLTTFSSVTESAGQDHRRTDLVKNKTILRAMETGTLRMNGETYRRMRNYSKPTTTQSSKPTQSAPKALTLAAHLRMAESAQAQRRVANFGVIFSDVPRYLRTGSKGDNLDETRRLLMQQKFDHKKFNVFMNSKFGQYLYEGIEDPELDRKGITRTSEFITEKKTYAKAQRRAKHELLMMPKQEVVLDRDLIKTKQVINAYSPEYLQAIKKLIESNQFTKTPQTFFEYFYQKLQNLHFSPQEMNRLHRVIQSELKKHTMSVQPPSSLLSKKMADGKYDSSTTRKVEKIVERWIENSGSLTDMLDREIRTLGGNTTDASADANSLAVEQMIKQIEDTGPDEYVTNKKKDAAIRLTQLCVFQDLMQLMGLPYKDITDKNLDDKMTILDRLKKQDFQKFIVNPRPELLDPNYKPNKKREDSDEKKKQTIKQRLERRYIKDKETDVYEKKLKQAETVINGIKRRKRNKIKRLEARLRSRSRKEISKDISHVSQAPAVTVSAQPSKSELKVALKRRLQFEKQAETARRWKQQVEFTKDFKVVNVDPSSDSKPMSVVSGTHEDISEGEMSSSKDSHVVEMKLEDCAQDQLAVEGADPTGMSESSAYESSETESEQPDPWAHLPRVYKNPFAVTNEQTIKEMEARVQLASMLETPIVETAKIHTPQEIDVVQARLEIEKKKKQEAMLREISEKARQYDEEQERIRKEQSVMRKKEVAQTIPIKEKVTPEKKLEVKPPVKEDKSEESSVQLQTVTPKPFVTPRPHSRYNFRQKRELTLEERQEIHQKQLEKTAKMQKRMNKIVIENIPEKFRPDQPVDLSQTQETAQSSKVRTQAGLMSAISHDRASKTLHAAGSTMSSAENPGRARVMSGLVPRERSMKFAQIVHSIHNGRIQSAVQGGRRIFKTNVFKRTASAVKSRNDLSLHRFATQQISKRRQSIDGKSTEPIVDIKVNGSHASVDSMSIRSTLAKDRSQKRPKAFKKVDALIQKFRDQAIETTRVNDNVIDRINDMNDEILEAICRSQENTENAGNPRQLQQYKTILSDMRYEDSTARKTYMNKEALRTFNSDNVDISMFLLKMQGNQVKNKIWKAQPITIGPSTQLGKVIAAHT